MSNPVIILNEILEKAIDDGASDIHFEPYEKSLLIRYRIDGILKKTREIPFKLALPLISRIKVLVDLDIANSRLPQDGRTTFHYKNHKIDLRISTLPTLFGEKLVMRILDRLSLKNNLSGLGMEETDLLKWRSLIKRKQGLLLVTGPTGSGKTTTLYASLKEIKSEMVNIVTIEDPIEYEINGLNQVAINPTLSINFERGLRAILRQDPDIIMIGEIRDQETAKIAIKAALTGHLVLSTLHTKSALEAIVRLSEMEIAPYLIAAALTGVISQRLPRLYLSEENKYQGRTGIFELLTISGRLRELILNRAPLREFEIAAKAEGFCDLNSHGQKKIATGLTTREEILRVIDLDD